TQPQAPATPEPAALANPVTNTSARLPATPSVAPAAAPRVAQAAAPAVPAAPAAPISLSFEGHIERRGDVTVRDDWLGNPQGNARIEGFNISWPTKPQGVDLAYSCRVAGLGK